LKDVPLSRQDATTMPHVLRVVFGLTVVGLLIGGPAWYYALHQRCFRNFHVVQDGVLYRSGQLDLAGLKRLIHDYGIKTVISLRDGEKSSDLDEEKYLAGQTDVNFIRIPPRAWWASDGSVPAEIGLAQFREILDNPANHPVLVHCFAGVHRTGAFCAVRRIDHDNYANEEAIREMKNLGYAIEHMDVLPYLKSYRPHALTGKSPPLRTVSQQKTQAP
jgi:tyrosine-protein phosphatase SIW14